MLSRRVPRALSGLLSCSRFISRNWRRRLFSSSSRDGGIKTWEVRCGSAGWITVDIYNAHLLIAPTNPLILYLPPTGAHLRHIHPEVPPFLLSNPNILSTQKHQYPLARINYRWNIPHPVPGSPHLLSTSPKFANHAFPTPLHDTLHAYTWLTTSFLPTFTAGRDDSSSPPRSPSPYAAVSSYTAPPRTPPRPLIIYGSFLGGTLATSLALTESHTRPQSGVSIHGVIIHNGIFDWTVAATSKPPTPTPSHLSNQASSTREQQELLETGAQGWDFHTLHRLKEKLFSNPSSAFDAFASPILFFRSSGLAIPSHFPGTEPVAPPIDDAILGGLSLSDEELAALRERHGAPSPSSSSSSSEEEEALLPSTPRKSPLKFPPTDSNLRIPNSLFLTSPTPSTEEEPTTLEMQRQAHELATAMRRSIVMHEFRARKGGREIEAHARSEERVRVCEVRETEMEIGNVVGEWMEGRV